MSSLRLALKLSLADAKPGEVPAAVSKEISGGDKLPGPKKRRGSGSFEGKDSTKKKPRKAEDGKQADEDSVEIEKKTEESSLHSRYDEEESFDKSITSSPVAHGSSSNSIAADVEAETAELEATQDAEAAESKEEPAGEGVSEEVQDDASAHTAGDEETAAVAVVEEEIKIPRKKRTPSILKALEISMDSIAAITDSMDNEDFDDLRPRYQSNRAAARLAKTKLTTKPAVKDEDEVSVPAEAPVVAPKARNRGGSSKKAAPVVPVEWVQCDKCNKWRSIAPTVNKNSLPDSWFCEMSTWSTVFNTCEAAEEDDTTAAAAAAPAIALPTDDQSETKATPRKTKSSSRTRAMTDEVDEEEEKTTIVTRKRQPKPTAQPPQPINAPAGMPTTPGSVQAVNWVQCNKCRKWRKVPESIEVDSLPERWFCSLNTWSVLYARCSTKQEEDDTSTPAPLTMGSNRNRRSAPAPMANTITLDNGVKVQQINWVRCEHKNCKKWRKVPAHIDMDSMPEKWYCEYNTWDQDSANCDAAEDSDSEAENQQAGGSARNGLIMANSKGATQLSYRRIIFGNDGKIRTCFSDKNKLGTGIFSYIQPNRVVDSEDVREPARKLTYWWSSAYDDSKALAAANAASYHGKKKQAEDASQGPKIMSTTEQLQENKSFYLLDAIRKLGNRNHGQGMYSAAPLADHSKHIPHCLPVHQGKAQRIVDSLTLFQRLDLENKAVRSAFLAVDGRRILLVELYDLLQELRFPERDLDAVREIMSFDNMKMVLKRLEARDEVDVCYTAAGQMVATLLLPLATLYSQLAAKNDKHDRIFNKPKFGDDFAKEGMPLKMRKFYGRGSKRDLTAVPEEPVEEVKPKTPARVRNTSSSTKSRRQSSRASRVDTVIEEEAVDIGEGEGVGAGDEEDKEGTVERVTSMISMASMDGTADAEEEDAGNEEQQMDADQGDDQEAIEGDGEEQEGGDNEDVEEEQALEQEEEEEQGDEQVEQEEEDGEEDADNDANNSFDEGVFDQVLEINQWNDQDVAEEEQEDDQEEEEDAAQARMEALVQREDVDEMDLIESEVTFAVNEDSKPTEDTEGETRSSSESSNDAPPPPPPEDSSAED